PQTPRVEASPPSLHDALPISFDGGDKALRRVTHHLLNDAPGLVEQTKYNVVVARLMELVNAIRKTIDSGAGAADVAVREAVETVDRKSTRLNSSHVKISYAVF